MEELFRHRIGNRVAVIVATDRTDGDVHPERVARTELSRRQHAVAGSDWVMLDEVHGVEIHRVAGGTEHWPLAAIGDVLVGDPTLRPFAIWAGDCAPLALVGDDGSTVVMAHAGWRGIAAGVVDVAVDALEANGASVDAAVLGPCIHPCCYEFGIADLADVAAGVHSSPDDVSTRAPDGRLMLDVPAAITRALAERDVRLDRVGACTGCDGQYFSHRRRAESGRHALVAWFEQA